MRRPATVVCLALSGIVVLACRTDFSVEGSPDGGADGSAVVCTGGTCQLQDDAGTGDDAAVIDGSSDASLHPDGGGPPYVTGHTCAKPIDCASGLCADSSVLGVDTFSKVGAVCTTPCCTSEQCGAGLVCVGPGTGGHYCVPAAPLGRQLGKVPGGGTCSTGAECRAGVCVGGVCADSCCADTQCGSATCKPVDVLGNGHTSYACSATGGPAAGQACAGTFNSCASGVCASSVCLPPCCSLSTVKGSGNTVCTAQALANGDTFTFSNGGTTGALDLGSACTQGTACLSGYCDKADGAAMGTCSDVCCTDADCKSPFVCRPRTGLTHFLRCTAP